MANSTRSGTRHSSDRTEHRRKGDDQALRPADHGVRSGRIEKRHRRASNRVTTEVYTVTEPSNEILTNEANDSEEDDNYEDEGTDKDCSEGSGYATEKDTPTRIALERRQESRREKRAKITTRLLQVPPSHKKDLLLPSPHPSATTTPSTTTRNQHQSIGGITILTRSVLCESVNIIQGRTPSCTDRSSSVGRSSPCVRGRSPGVGSRSSSAGFCSPIVAGDSPGPVNAPAGPDFGSIRGRKNLVTGGERMLLEYAAVQILPFTLFTDPFPSAPDLTSYIHLAWEDAERHHLTQIEASPESLALVRARRKIVYGSWLLTVI